MTHAAGTSYTCYSSRNDAPEEIFESDLSPKALHC
ncbi:hypothetical protein NIT7321_02714 [Phaeobacter italicus]|uniref:Uncharacterized protein n=1 Tax=Phaeobacter italicus TaxID=481446 RepID=A0A0H5D493_9RHOB|nr:hypothetical protein NIT7321_02714 [Phaeobacter italicus]